MFRGATLIQSFHSEGLVRLTWGALLRATQSLLRLEPLSLETWARIVVIALSVIFVVELHKLARRSHPVRACRRPTLMGS